MTTTVTVKARAHGAKVSLTNASGPQEFDIPGNTERTFHIDDSHSLTVTQGVPSELNPTPFQGEAVPGAAENDALLGNVAAGESDSSADASSGEDWEK